MHSDSYQTFIKTLNASEPFPPFQEIRTLVMQQNGRRKPAFIPFYRYASVAALFAVLGLLIGNHFLSNESVRETQAGDRSQMTHVSHGTDESTSMEVTTNEATRNIVRLIESPASPTLVNVHPENIPSANTTHTPLTEAPYPPPSNTQAITTPTATSSVSTTLAELSNPNGTTANHWTAFLSGGSFVPSTNFTMSYLFGAAGARYLLSGSSSLVVELRRSSFVVNHAAQSGNSRDTMVSVGGVPTQLTLGNLSLSATTSSSPVNSLDVGYRFDWNPNDVFSPIAEILVGASTSGFLSSEAAGVEYRFANSLSFDVSARAEQLFSPVSVPLSALGFEAGIGFEW
jgi:hypothetical protein